MKETITNYQNSVRSFCSELRLDYFPQAEAGELLSRAITLKDIYQPLTLADSGSSSFSGNLLSKKIQQLDGEELTEQVRQIEEIIAELDEKIKKSFEGPDDRDLCRLPQEASGTGKSGALPAGGGTVLLLEAEPGSGKTTFCKRLALALLEDDPSFFKKCIEDALICFHTPTTPVFVSCRNAAGLSETELREADFPDLLYRLTKDSLGNRFPEIPAKQFSDMVKLPAPGKLTLLFDGWDEIPDAGKANLLAQKIRDFTARYPRTDVVVTIRENGSAPALDYTHHCAIRPLSDDGIREFCGRWCQTVLGSDRQTAKNGTAIAEQILSSAEPQITSMRRNPMDLSFLLTVSKNSGRLPGNKAELFGQLVDLYLFWSTNKGTGRLSAKSARVFLAYIASHFTKKDLMFCSENELLRIVRQAQADLNDIFPDEILDLDPAVIAGELAGTRIFVRTRGNYFTFSEEFSGGIHRQMQKYLTAYAILGQYADKTWNSLSPVEILEDKYGLRSWREVIHFIMLMNNGRLRQQLVKSLIRKTEEDSDISDTCGNLLFRLIAEGADIRTEDRHKIYDTIFPQSITDRQLADIKTFTAETTRTSADFTEYISTKFAERTEKGDWVQDYGYAKAAIEASLAFHQGISPFERAEGLMRSGQDADVAAGALILSLLAWCRYARIGNIFPPFTHRLRMNRMPKKWIARFRSLYRLQRCIFTLSAAIRDAILAGFADYADFFDAESTASLCSQLEQTDARASCLYILSVVPVFQPEYRSSSAESVKNRYLQRLEKEISEKNYDEIIFTFNICAAIGCWKEESLKQEWEKIEDLYQDLPSERKDDGSACWKRYAQLSWAAWRIFPPRPGKFKNSPFQ